MNVEFSFTLLLFLLFLSYCTLNSFVIFGLWKLVHGQKNTSVDMPNISVVVAARNEEANIGRCLQSLVQQNYPQDLFEIIVADDRSTDGTAAIVKNYQRRHSNIALISIGNIASGLPPKKNALNEAIKKSKYDILAFTDADCAPPALWLSSIAKEFLPEVGAVAGYCTLEQQFPETFFGRWFNLFLRYLELKKIAGAAAGVGLNNAYLASGGNFAYRKSVFHEVHGFEKIKHSISGDDDLFLQVIQRETRWKIRYMTSKESSVETAPPRTFGHFVKQKRRHISASRHYSPLMKIVFGLIHSFNALAIVSILFFPWIGVISLAAKLIVDSVVFRQASLLFGEAGLRRSVIPLEIASVLYNSLIGPLGLVGAVSWKGSKT